MLAARSSRSGAAARLVRPAARRAQRRFESSGAQHEEQHAHPAPQNESLGARFFLVIAAMPLAWVAYDATTSDPNNPSALTRYLGSFDGWQREYERRNDQHARLIQQAAFDRNLLGSAQPSYMIDLKFPEQFNTGSPFNNVAGQRADLKELVEHYHRKNKEMEERVASKTPEQREIS